MITPPHYCGLERMKALTFHIPMAVSAMGLPLPFFFYTKQSDQQHCSPNVQGQCQSYNKAFILSLNCCFHPLQAALSKSSFEYLLLKQAIILVSCILRIIIRHPYFSISAPVSSSLFPWFRILQRCANFTAPVRISQKPLNNTIY